MTLVCAGVAALCVWYMGEQRDNSGKVALAALVLAVSIVMGSGGMP